MAAVTQTTVPTPYGDGRLLQRRAARPVATMLLSHGAGGGVDSRDLQALALGLPSYGVSVLLFEQPWKVAGKKIASPPKTLDTGLTAVADQLRSRTPLIVGGRSAGARSACRTAKSLGATGCLALAFPLHPPGRPEKSRLDELAHTQLPTLVVQGERDPFGRPEEFPALPRTELVEVPYADHGFKIPARHLAAEEMSLRGIVDAVAEWTLRLVG
ncbi:alpha/beta family hydrolase [Nocardioides sp. Kera G14]|uniref:alpha/beta hydrolase family protein n=1 Tax=Nocardioides sp. Kera G14 TaxID=2884264 RepID=UPI001D0F986F|nr:alpha/beta family hydrolase [Nocardioides sp. Kera G14]UDY24681.1 hydrolase [Nocardioides sp. Kera G14]